MALSHKPTYWVKQNGSGDKLFQSQNCNKIPLAKLTVKRIIYCKHSIFIYNRQKHPLDVFYNFMKKETLKHVFFCEFFKMFKNTFLNPIQDGGRRAKMASTSFSTVTPVNVKISPPTFLVFNFNHFATQFQGQT